MKKIYFLLSMGLLFSFNSLLAQCDLKFEPPDASFTAGDHASVIICFQDYSTSGLPTYEKADWDLDDLNGADVVVVNAVGPVDVSAMGTGNSIQSSYCIKVEFTVGTANITKITATAKGIDHGCETTETTSYNTFPIVLESFDVKYANGRLDFAWVTLSEINNDFFTVELSENGVDYISLGTVKGAANSLDRKEYAYSHKYDAFRTPFLYFRLKQTDLDGKYTYSEIKVVKNEKNSKSLFTVNKLSSVSNTLYLELSSNDDASIIMEIFDINGNMIVSNQTVDVNEGMNLIEIPFNRPNTGILIARFVNGDNVENKKFFCN